MFNKNSSLASSTKAFRYEQYRAKTNKIRPNRTERGNLRKCISNYYQMKLAYNLN